MRRNDAHAVPFYKRIPFANRQTGRRRWTLTFLLANAAIILFIGIVNFIVDPFQQYRATTFYMPSFEDQRYINAGLAKNYDYDAVVIGSSMTENFLLSDLKNILDYEKPIKLCTRGGSIYEESQTLETALKHRNVKQVLFGLDVYSFSANITPLSADSYVFPLFLYDDNYLNDYKYLLNTDVFAVSMERVIVPFDQKKLDATMNDLYQWQTTYTPFFKLKYVYEEWDKWEAKFRARTEKEDRDAEEKFAFHVLRKHFDDTLLPLIKAHPETQFDIFYPPYSVLYFKMMEREKRLDDYIRFKAYLAKTLAPLNNVRLYDFQVADEVTHNLHNYKDLNHYHQKFNTWMLEQMRLNRFSVTDDEAESINARFAAQVKAYKVLPFGDKVH